MKIDVHTHIFPPEVIEKREHFLEGEPAFASIYSNPQANMVTAEGLVQAMDEADVAVSWAMGFPWQHREHARLHNDYLEKSFQRHHKRLRVMACMDAAQPWAIAEAERSLAMGLHGLGELAFYTTDLDLDALNPLAALCAEADKPLLLHTNEPVGHIYPGKAPMTLAALYAFIKANQNCKLVLAHMGAGLFSYALLKKEVREMLENVWLDTAASVFLYRPETYRLALELMGPDKILMGSDYPLLPVPRYEKEFAKPEAGLTSQQIEAMMGESAAKLLS